jgi:SOS-response transcriptional repressor LexA
MDKYEKRRAALQALIDGLGRGGISKVAEKIDKQPSYVSRMLFPPTKDGFKRIGGDTVDVLNAAFPGWLGEEPNVQLDLNLYPDRRGYPVISPVQTGNWREIVDTFPRGSADEYRMASNEYGPHTFALRIVGNSMEPEFMEGDLVFIDPDVTPRPGNYVVAKNHEEEATFKKYRPRGIDANGVEIFELVPLNPDYAVMRSDHQPIKIIGTMMEHTRYRR